VVYNRIQAAINRGVYPPGSRLPSERQLAAELGISRVTLRKALGALSADGLITNSPQTGWFVHRSAVGEPPNVLQTFSEMAWSRGLKPVSKVLSQGKRAATLAEAGRLQVAPASLVFEITRLRGMDDTLICYDTSVIPLTVAEPLLDLDLTDQSLYQMLEQHCGLRIQYSKYSVRAEGASKELAALLGIRIGGPVLAGVETAFSSNDVPVILGTAQYRGDAYVFHADLYRPNA
jgi:GntR family transcriptional regulator